MIKFRKFSAILIGAVTVTAFNGSIFASNLEEDTKKQHQSRVNITESILAQGLIDDETASNIETYLQSKIDNRAERREMKGVHTEVYDEMLTEGILTQDEVDAIITYYSALTPVISEESPGEKEDMRELGEAGTEMKGRSMGNRAEMDGGKAEMKAERPEMDLEHLPGEMNAENFDNNGGNRKEKNHTNKLVEEGIISEETAAEMQEYMKNNQLDVNNAEETDGEREKFIKHDIFRELLENNIITQEQYDAIAAAQVLLESN